MLPHHPLVLVQIADDLITTKSTGTPCQITQCFSLSERVAYYLLKQRTPIVYSYRKKVGIVQKPKIALLFLSFFLLGFGSELRAQVKDTLRLKWEIGTDLLWLLDKNSLPKFSLFARRILSDKSALRLRFGADIKTDPRNLGLGVEKASFLLKVGYEKRKKIAHNANIFWGFDAHFRKENIEAYLIQLPQVKPLYYPDYSWQLGGVAVLGVRYFFGQNFSICAEASLAAYYREFSSNHYTSGSLIVINGNYTNGGDFVFLYRTNLKSFVLEMSPMQVLNFSYHF